MLITHGVLIRTPTGDRWMMLSDIEDGADPSYQRMFLSESEAVHAAERYTQSFKKAGISPPSIFIAAVGEQGEVIGTHEFDSLSE